MLGQLGRIPGVGPGLDFRTGLGDGRLALLASRDLFRNREPLLLIIIARKLVLRGGGV
jgi:hypothetical protein